MPDALKQARQQQNRKEMVSDIFHLIGAERPKDGLEYFARDCVQHNPYVERGH